MCALDATDHMLVGFVKSDGRRRPSLAKYFSSASRTICDFETRRALAAALSRAAITAGILIVIVTMT